MFHVVLSHSHSHSHAHTHTHSERTEHLAMRKERASDVAVANANVEKSTAGGHPGESFEGEGRERGGRGLREGEGLSHGPGERRAGSEM